MTTGPRSCRLVRPLAVAAFVGALLAGCGDGADHYPKSLQYPTRSDLLVKDLPKGQPTRFNNPGHMPVDFIQTLSTRYDVSLKARTVDMARVEEQSRSGNLRLDDNDKVLLEEVKANNILDPRNLATAERTKLDELLRAVFGTPAEPTVKHKDQHPLGVAKEVVEQLQLDDVTLREGSRMYRRHCLHCHGLEGNGRGPTGPWVNPHPRDFRQGVFKFTSSSQDLGSRKPRREDLMHILVHGIEGSAMPSFALYPESDLQKIVSYVIHLSMRGEVEFYVIREWLTQGASKLAVTPRPEEVDAVRTTMTADKRPAEEIQKTIEELNTLAKGPAEADVKAAQEALQAKFAEATEGFPPRWVEAQTAAIKPENYPYPDTEDALLESASRGARLFNVGSASCVSCHKNYGREAPYSFDAWGTIVRPRNLIDGYYRGGRRPVDLYLRTWSGIAGAGMTNYSNLKNDIKPSDLFLDDRTDPAKVAAFDQDPANVARLRERLGTIDPIWDLVNFMQVLHYPDLRAKLRAKYNVALD
jgi:mono/diheme cytochrome c family protein